MRLSYQYQEGEFSAAQLIAEQKIAKASTGAVREAADLAKAAGRRAIAAAGFSSRWQNALRAKVYPQTGYSIDAAAYIWHKIPYAGIFETGGTIAGHPLLWLPIGNAPPIGKFNGKLISINRPGKPPLLATVAPARRGKKRKRCARSRQLGADVRRFAEGDRAAEIRRHRRHQRSRRQHRRALP